MKSIINFLKKIIKLALIVAIIAIAWVMVSKHYGSVDTFVAQPTEYEQRVAELMSETKTEWEQKHKNWAEEEVTKEIISEQEAKLESIRVRELSL